MKRSALRAAPALLLIVIASAPAGAQMRPADQARQFLEEGRAYRREGKLKQALESFTRIITTADFARTDSVDDALLELGQYYLDVEGDVVKARQTFERITTEYSQSDCAPGAYYWLGRLSLSRATTMAELEDALAQFGRVQRLYPRSAWVAHALYASGLMQRKAGRLDLAIDYERRAVLEYPSSDAAPTAQFELARDYAIQGEPFRAMEEFQQVRNRFPDSPWLAHALDRTTALWRLYGGENPTFTLDGSFSLGLGDILKDVNAILVAPDGTLWIASGKAKSAVPVSRDGKPGPTLALEEPQTLSLAPNGDIVAVGRLAVRIGPKDVKTFVVPSDKPGVPESLEKLTAAVVLPGGGVLVADDKKKRVYRYDEKLQNQGPFPDAKEREVSRLSLDPEGGIVVLDDREKSVRVYDVTGRQLRAILAKGPTYEIKHPVDVAIDSFRNVYIADGEGGVFIFDGKGQLLTKVTGELRKPRALAIEADGALLVYDDKAERILRYR
jgi:TolA-binding protein